MLARRPGCGCLLPIPFVAEPEDEPLDVIAADVDEEEAAPRKKRRKPREDKLAADVNPLKMDKMTGGCCMLLFASMLLVWIFYNLFVERQIEFRLSVGGILFVIELTPVGIKWLRVE